MIDLILGILLLIFGIYCLVKPANFLLRYLPFYYNKKQPLKPITYRGGLGRKHIEKFGKSNGMIIFMRIFGVIASIIGVIFILSYFQII